MTLSFSYIGPLSNFKASYKGACKKKPPLRSGEPTPSPAIDFLLHHWLCILEFYLQHIECNNDAESIFGQQKHLRLESETQNECDILSKHYRFVYVLQVVSK